MLKRLVKEEEFDYFLLSNQDKLTLVKFSTTWCVPCRQLQKNIEDLLVERKDLTVLEVDADKFPGLAQRPEFSIRSVPTIFLFLGNKMIKKDSGSMSVQQLKEFIKV